MIGKEGIRAEEKRALSPARIRSLKRVDGRDHQITTAKDQAAAAYGTADAANNLALAANAVALDAINLSSVSIGLNSSAASSASTANTLATNAMAVVQQTYSTAQAEKSPQGHGHGPGIARGVDARRGQLSRLEKRASSARTVAALRGAMLEFIAEIREAREHDR